LQSSELSLIDQGVPSGSERVKPIVVAGGLTAVVTGGLMAVLTASSGGLTASLPAVAVLTLALVVGGVTYGLLVDSERMRGGFGSGILFWTAALPAARLAQELLMGAGLRESLPAFLAYQALVGGAFGLGFLLLHNQIWTWLSAAERRRSARSGKVAS
jgi:hypothetical protein